MLLSGLGDRKKLATEIVMSMGPKKPFTDRKEKGYNEENVSNEKPAKEYSEYNAMADEMMNCFKEGDSEKLASCLKAFASMFEPAHQGMDSEMEGEE